MKRKSMHVAAAVIMGAVGFGATAQAGIINGGFETGDFSGWTVSGFYYTDGNGLSLGDANHTTVNFLADEADGDAKAPTNGVVTSQTSNFDGFGPGESPAVLPTEGNYLGFISNETSAGNLTLTGSAIRQTFTVGSGATALTFDVQFLSNEVIDSNWDFGGVALLDGDGNVIADFTLDHDPTTGTSPTDVHATATAAGGFNDSTGWLSESFDLSDLAGQTVTLLAYSTNTGDSSVESRTLLDNVVEVAPTVPEPTSLALLGLGLAGLGAMRRRRAA